MDHGGNGMPRGMLPSNMGSGGLLGLDMAMPPHQQQMQQQAHHMLTFQAAGDVGEHHPLGRLGQYVPTFVRNKQQPPPPPLPQKPGLSSEDEPGYGEAEPADDQAARRSLTQPAPAASPWQRMKWTDSMVRFLIKVLYRVGGDGGDGGDGGGGAEGEQQQQVAGGKGKSEAGEGGAAAVLLQKKGKWKSVSRAMMEKGFSVSPQQCEDKFNDLNKRYKRVNDLLGKGTACRVVENQALLDTMDHLSHKAKQEARKLLNSKHLFFREMCAYHHAGGGGSCVSAAAPPPQQVPPQSHQDPQQLQLCFHHSQCSRSDAKGVVSSRAVPAPVAADEEGMVIGEEVDDDDDVESEDEEDFDDGDYEEKDDFEEGHDTKTRHHPQHKHEEGEEDVDSKELVLPGRKKRKVPSQMSVSPPLSLTLSSQSGTMQQLQSELMASMPSGNGSGGGGEQQQQWLQKKATELEEQRVAYQCRSFQLERQRYNWFRFCTNKEREMERTKLENERLRLENDRMLLLLRQKELELIQTGGGFANSEQQLQVANADHPRSTAA